MAEQGVQGARPRGAALPPPSGRGTPPELSPGRHPSLGASQGVPQAIVHRLCQAQDSSRLLGPCLLSPSQVFPKPRAPALIFQCGETGSGHRAWFCARCGWTPNLAPVLQSWRGWWPWGRRAPPTLGTAVSSHELQGHRLKGASDGAGGMWGGPSTPRWGPARPRAVLSRAHHGHRPLCVTWHNQLVETALGDHIT